MAAVGLFFWMRRLHRFACFASVAAHALPMAQLLQSDSPGSRQDVSTVMHSRVAQTVVFGLFSPMAWQIPTPLKLKLGTGTRNARAKIGCSKRPGMKHNHNPIMPSSSYNNRQKQSPETRSREIKHTPSPSKSNSDMARKEWWHVQFRSWNHETHSFAFCTSDWRLAHSKNMLVNADNHTK